jgi:hypothetical protein
MGQRDRLLVLLVLFAAAPAVVVGSADATKGLGLPLQSDTGALRPCGSLMPCLESHLGYASTDEQRYEGPRKK